MDSKSVHDILFLLPPLLLVSFTSIFSFLDYFYPGLGRVARFLPAELEHGQTTKIQGWDRDEDTTVRAVRVEQLRQVNRRRSSLVTWLRIEEVRLYRATRVFLNCI